MIQLDPICASARFPAASEKKTSSKSQSKKMDTPAYEHVNPGDPLAKIFQSSPRFATTSRRGSDENFHD